MLKRNAQLVMVGLHLGQHLLVGGAKRLILADAVVVVAAVVGPETNGSVGVVEIAIVYNGPTGELEQTGAPIHHASVDP